MGGMHSLQSPICLARAALSSRILPRMACRARLGFKGFVIDIVDECDDTTTIVLARSRTQHGVWSQRLHSDAHHHGNFFC